MKKAPWKSAINALSIRMHQKIWWIDVVWPLLLALSMITALTQIIYAGQLQMRLVNIAEDALLDFSLVQSGGRSASKDAGVIIVSVKDSDKASLGRITGPGGSDIRLDTYARLVTKLAAMGVSDIYIRLVSDIHDIYGPDFNPLLSAAENLPKGTQLHLGYSYRDRKNLLQIVGQRIHVVDDDACIETDLLQSKCSFNPDWNYWVVQNIFATSAQHTNRDANPKSPPSWVSDTFASRYPSYILNLPSPDSLPAYSVSEILNDNGRPSTNLKMAFVGPGLSDEAAVSKDYDLPFVQTQYDVMAKKGPSTPLHVFWGQIGEMFLSGQVVHMPPTWVIRTVSGVFCILIVLVMVLFRGPVALGSFVIYSATGPLINALSIKYLNLYVPMFETFYFGLTTLVVAGFSQLSISALQKWRSEEKRKVHARTSDVKSNFISLLSHNLNTPIAKMQGTLALLSNLPTQGEWKDDVRAAESHVAQLEMAVRAVLTATAIEEGAVMTSPITVKALVDDFKNNATGTLKRLGVTLNVGEPRGNSDDLHLPLLFDAKTVTVGLSSLAALFSANDGPFLGLTSVSINFDLNEAIENEEGTSVLGGLLLICTVESDQRWISSNALATLRSDTSTSVRTRSGSDFLSDVLAGIGLEMVRRFNGIVDLTPRAKGGRITVILRPETRALTSRSAVLQ